MAEGNTNGKRKRLSAKGRIFPWGDLERAMNTHRGKPGHQALEKSFPGRAFSNRAEGMVHVSSEVEE
jgi:hypothetical protein